MVLFFSGITYGQTPTEKIVQGAVIPEVKVDLDKMPVYINGEDKLKAFLQSNLNWQNILDTIGKVFVKFIVTEKGDVKDPEILKGLNKKTNEECIRVTKLLKFHPAEKNGKPVSTYLNLPFSISKRNKLK